MTFGEALRMCRGDASTRAFVAELEMLSCSHISKLERDVVMPTKETFDALRELFPGKLTCPMCGVDGTRQGNGPVHALDRR